MTYSTPEDFRFPILQWDEKKELWLLIEDYVFTWRNKKRVMCRRTVKKGFEYDKASVPRRLWGLARTDGPWEAGSIFHDDAYKQLQHNGRFEPGSYQQQVGNIWIDIPKMTRAEADDLLEYIGKLGGADKFEAWEYKWAVKLFPINWFKGF